jgi:hypothetical protein
MKTYYLILIVSFFVVACSTTEKRVKPNFREIEITYYNGWTGGQTIHIDSSGRIIKCKYHIISDVDSAICCIDTLSISQLDTIILKFRNLTKLKIDSIYDGHCEDCGGYIIKLVSINTTIKSMIIGLDKFDNEISTFAKYVSNIKIKPNKLDSIYIFETTKFIIPPKLPDSLKNVRFLPPKNDEIEK